VQSIHHRKENLPEANREKEIGILILHFLRCAYRYKAIPNRRWSLTTRAARQFVEIVIGEPGTSVPGIFAKLMVVARSGGSPDVILHSRTAGWHCQNSHEMCATGSASADWFHTSFPGFWRGDVS
jgi:hypothetical protein